MTTENETSSGVLIWDDIALRLFFRSPFEPVARDLARRAIQIESAAKVNASGRPGPNVITGRLRASISWKLGEDDVSIYVDIGSNVSYAAYVELGHPNTAHGFKTAPGRGIGGGTYGYVSSKPTRAYSYLRPALAAGLI